MMGPDDLRTEESEASRTALHENSNINSRHGYRLRNTKGDFLTPADIIEGVKNRKPQSSFIHNFGYENTQIAKLNKI